MHGHIQKKYVIMPGYFYYVAEATRRRRRILLAGFFLMGLWDLLTVLRFIFLMGSETFMDDVKNLLELIDIDLSWR